MLNCRWVERISKRLSILLWIGKISYAIYLLHFPLIQTLSCTLFLALYGMMDRNSTIVLTFIVTFAVLIPLSILFNQYIERIGNEAIEYIL